jgi:rhodanese-related sulfurtransferase
MGNQQKKSKKMQQKKQPIWLWIVMGIVVVGIIVTLALLNGGVPASSMPDVSSTQIITEPSATEDIADSKLPDSISVQEASEQFSNGAFLLDVREQSEWDEGHVEGAVLIPLGELSTRISELPTDQDILIICRSGNRSGQARDLLREAGMMNTTSVSGGMNAWIAAGLPVVTGL